MQRPGPQHHAGGEQACEPMGESSCESALGQLCRASSHDLYGTLFMYGPIAILEEDWTGPWREVQRVLASGVQDFDDFLASNPSFIAEVRREHRVLDANLAALQLFGLTEDDKADFLAHAGELLPANPDSNGRVLKAFASGARSAEGERLLKQGPDQYVPILWRTLIPPPDGDFSRLLFYAVDVSALKRAQEELVTTQGELARASKIAMVGEMTASIAHEINQPLGAIRLFADTALRWLDRGVPSIDRARRSLNEVAANAERASRIVQRVRNLVRHEPPATQRLALRPAVLAVFALLARDARKARAQLICTLPDTLPDIAAEQTQLQQVLVNLFSNALQAMSHAATPAARLEVHGQLSDKAQLLVIVDDNGPGLSKEASERLFAPFYSTKSDGMGLGLSICRSIVEAHGGRITAGHRPDGLPGARFTFTLPLAA
ncbi:MAG: PAS domain-containing sensor histidine kinase [Roseateles sp.]|nr:MAG: PAS domain-containing sensor histidine kinase [Roseateles sp.]